MLCKDFNATRDPDGAFLQGRGAQELRIVASLSGKWPYLSPDPIWSAAWAIDRMKEKYAELWAALIETTVPAVTADCVVSVVLSECRGAF